MRQRDQRDRCPGRRPAARASRSGSRPSCRCTAMNRSGPDGEPDPAVAERDQVCDRQLHRGVRRREDTNGASTAGSQPLTNTTGSRRSTSAWYRSWSAPVSACRPDTKMIPETPRSSSISTYSSSVTPPGVLRAQHRCEAALRQRRLDHLGERREDRVVSSGITSPTSPADCAPQPGRALVPQHVERGQHGLFRVRPRPPACRSAPSTTVASLTPALAAMSASRALLLTPGTVPSPD